MVGLSDTSEVWLEGIDGFCHEDDGDGLIGECGSTKEVVGHETEDEDAGTDDDGHDLAEACGCGDGDGSHDKYGTGNGDACNGHLWKEVSRERLGGPFRAQAEDGEIGGDTEGEEGEHGGLWERPSIEEVGDCAEKEAERDGSESEDEDWPVEGICGGAHDTVTKGEHEEDEHNSDGHEYGDGDTQKFSQHNSGAWDRFGDHGEERFVFDFAAEDGGCDEGGEEHSADEDCG